MCIFHSLINNALFVLAVALQRSHAFAPALFVSRQQASRLHAVTPVGPFCPFRSSSSIELEPKMEAINAAGPEFAKEMTKIQLDMSIGEMPDPERLHRVADGLEQAVDQWESLVARLRLSSDFQTREYAKLTQAHLQSHGMTVDGIASMIRWQAGCMRAMANNTPPPMPPANMDLEQLMNNSNQQQREKPSITAMAAAEAITATPFSKNSPAFDAPNVKQEHDALCRDHRNLIEFGAKYDSFDPLGKLYYLDEIEKIEDRWDVFFTRFKLMGQLDATYLQQCDRFLASMGMNEEEYRKLLKQSHALMRAEAEAERNLYVA
ncbi:hypothetical protein FisN_13Hh100 [Fistulifera solaris]|jgi:hypothetical protein|uniref:Uncharacterized protein n=1 Tax=Fistulifera solaris TaxID=1519565 RepID=A0A1Z5KN87_FISSO|nr:hypothetical protein FisN_13Hh100 [Fistulifera solaris]|eukprot:GAX27793.1 hypothetical protein FisN_13Hh100 [Fistulifera solaris]